MFNKNQGNTEMYFVKLSLKFDNSENPIRETKYPKKTGKSLPTTFVKNSKMNTKNKVSTGT